MAKQDVTDVWANGTTGIFTYGNGETVNYTIGTRGDYDGNNSTVTGGGMSHGAYLNSNITSGINTNYAELSFDTAIRETSFSFIDFNGVEEVQFTLDGNVVNLYDMVLAGEASITGNGSIQGIAALNGNGNLQYNAISELVTVTFHVPVTSVRATELVGPVNGAVGMDFHLDTDFPPTGAPCFTAGTLIETDQGPVAVETLQAGDMIRTKDHGFQPVKWVGTSRIYASGFDVPLRIKKGTFGNTRDLVVSPRHRMLIEGWELDLMFNHEEAFATAKDLRNDDTIVREPEGWVTYYHVLLPQHEVIYAEGAATESFYPDEGTLAGMAAATKNELLEHFDAETYGPPSRPTFDPMRAMWIGRNLDVLKGNDMGQIAAYENAQKAAE